MLLCKTLPMSLVLCSLGKYCPNDASRSTPNFTKIAFLAPIGLFLLYKTSLWAVKPQAKMLLGKTLPMSLVLCSLGKYCPIDASRSTPNFTKMAFLVRIVFFLPYKMLLWAVKPQAKMLLCMMLPMSLVLCSLGKYCPNDASRSTQNFTKLLFWLLLDDFSSIKSHCGLLNHRPRCSFAR